MIAQQPQAEDGRNFTDPAESYKTGEQSHFRTGLNELVFEIKNFRDPSGFDYRAVVNYMPSTPVLIDIKPGEYPNTINLGSNGVVPVAILSTLIFDATQVDPLTVTRKRAGGTAWQGNAHGSHQRRESRRSSRPVGPR